MQKVLGDLAAIIFRFNMEEEEKIKIATPQNFLMFPFLGSREDGESFEYLLLSVDNDFAEIAIPLWLVSRTKLHLNEKLDLYIPRQMNTEHLLRDDVSGIIFSVEYNKDLQTEVYKISFSKPMINMSLDHIFVDQFIFLLPTEMISPTDLLLKLIKDSMFLKSGMRVYFKHLIPYFSRIVDYSKKDYVNFEKVFLLDIMKIIKINESNLLELYTLLKEKLMIPEEIPIYIDLEMLRALLESEISLPIFNIAFSDTELSLLEQFQVHNEFGYSKYINAIKNLEKRLYSNYNLIVILYLKSL